MLELLERDQPASIERDVFPRLVGEGLYGYVGTATGSTSGRPSAIWRARSTSSRARSRTAVHERMGDGYLCVEAGRENAGRVIPSALVERGCRIGDGRADRRPRGARDAA